ncbi:hypothetical protein CBR_g22886 [Chara braunii]|uniref:Uncharacterized protein n=1 Tax=Chara braunii TaxID=69332 RepID=A0A388L2Y9_CHABU|nr:hypothetical protein CBR_g22886 [Chara braunii]|eukprot:GBG76669.1 hypothetical protein CBR_g22886 [Chara braunii]
MGLIRSRSTGSISLEMALAGGGGGIMGGVGGGGISAGGGIARGGGGILTGTGLGGLAGVGLGGRQSLGGLHSGGMAILPVSIESGPKSAPSWRVGEGFAKLLSVIASCDSVWRRGITAALIAVLFLAVGLVWNWERVQQQADYAVVIDCGSTGSMLIFSVSFQF